MVVLNINTDAVVRFTAKLERMHRSALPVAIRGALNNAAFDVKKTTMPASAKKAFTQRKPSFFSANSRVQQAQGFDIKAMKATVGFVAKSGDQAVEDLQQQEEGGSISGRGFIPLDYSRVGNSRGKNVRAPNRISKIKARIVDSKRSKGKTRGQRFIKAAVHAGKGGLVIGNNTRNGHRFLFLIRSVKRVGKDTKINSLPLFAVQAGRKVKPKPTHFMKKASEISAAKMEEYFIKQAKKQIEKLR